MKLQTLQYRDEAFASNRLYIMQHPDFSATVVDPASADEVLDFLAEHDLNLAGILVTHHHADHTEGIPKLLELYPGCPVITGKGVERYVKQANHILNDNDVITVGDTEVRAMATSGHTVAHYAFLTNSGVLFSGDCLFRLGCGRLFEGSPDMLWTSLLRLRALPDNTLVCCGHDYVIDNARFSLQLMPEDPALVAAVQELVEIAPENRLPYLLGDDKRSNLFLRADDPEVMIAVRCQSSRDALAALRRMRDNWNRAERIVGAA
ncbi:MAG: hydroxyacylglutathione hydrolase [Alphaproteobacteria bacterium]|nr:hydroxyacylglutathione hydrolase [Alphaproteobacteria bacterium]